MIVSALAVAAFYGQLHVSWTIVLVGLALTLLFSFFFTTVAANAIAATANNPASGMTLLTVIISAVVLLKFGLSGATGMFFAMALAAMVCVALCVSGQFITDLKAGYWIGSTPAAQEKVKFIGVAAAAVTAGLTIVLLAKAFQFGEAAPGDMRQVLVAPQASAMKAIVEGFMSGQPAPYVLFGIGALITVVLEMLKVSSMVFALGIYLPLQLTTPILAGGFLSHFVNKRAEKAGEAGRSITERGVIVAGGLMAGGALGGVFGAGLRLLPSYKEEMIQTPFYTTSRSRRPSRRSSSSRCACMCGSAPSGGNTLPRLTGAQPLTKSKTRYHHRITEFTEFTETINSKANSVSSVLPW